MGITIHYEGAFSPEKKLSEMISELEDIAKIQKWKYDIFEREFPSDILQFPWGKNEKHHPENLYGILLAPPDCEPLWFTFLSNGYSATVMGLEHWSRSKADIEKEMTHYCFTKTQFAGKDVHKIIIHLFRYISQKYYAEFKLSDETRYWETNDEKKLEEAFTRMNFLLDAFELRLTHEKMNIGENFLEYIQRMANEIHQNQKNSKSNDDVDKK